jgi:hypothetical protein
VGRVEDDHENSRLYTNFHIFKKILKVLHNA